MTSLVESNLKKKNHLVFQEILVILKLECSLRSLDKLVPLIQLSHFSDEEAEVYEISPLDSSWG